jgi:TorA maturation chaperone TorD
VTHLDSPTRAELAEDRSQSYWLLSRLFLETPDSAFLNQLEPVLRAACEAQSESGLEALRDAVHQSLSTTEAEPEAASVAFTRHVCLGKKGEPLPFEAHAREGKLPGESTEQVLVLMTQAGFDDVAPQASSPDHLGAELRFMAFLCLAERDAWANSESSLAARQLQLQRHFMQAHVMQWAGFYCADLARRASHPYVRAIAELAHTHLTEDARALETICHGLEAETAVAS